MVVSPSETPKMLIYVDWDKNLPYSTTFGVVNAYPNDYFKFNMNTTRDKKTLPQAFFDVTTLAAGWDANNTPLQTTNRLRS